MSKEKWEVKKLEEVCDFSNGLWKGKNPPFQKVGVIRNTNFSKDFQLDDSDIAYLEVEQKQFLTRKLEFGDIILEKSGGGPKQPVGRVIIFDKLDGDYSFSNFTSAIRVKNKRELDFTYLHRYLYLEYLSGRTENLQNHSTGIRNLRFKEYKEIEVPIPPLSEQQRIVTLLDEAFEVIDRTKANAEKNLENARELFESYLEDVFENKGEDWEEKKLKECFKLRSGDNLTAKEMTGNKYPVFGGNGIAGYHKEFNLSGSNVIIGRVGALCGNVRHITENIWLTDNAFRVIDYKYEFDDSFLAYLLNYKDLRSFARQAAQPVISNVALKDVKLQFPKSLEEQQSIVSRLDALRAETENLEAVYQQRIENLEELRKSILERAFKGEL